jgi:hypothetical protein
MQYSQSTDIKILYSKYCKYEDPHLKDQSNRLPKSEQVNSDSCSTAILCAAVVKFFGCMPLCVRVCVVCVCAGGDGSSSPLHQMKWRGPALFRPLTAQ